MEFVASTLHTTSEHGVSSITTAEAHTLGRQQSTELTPPADLNGLVLFAERRNLISARVPSHFNWPLLLTFYRLLDILSALNKSTSSGRILIKSCNEDGLIKSVDRVKV
jgi:hypothetical protein